MIHLVPGLTIAVIPSVFVVGPLALLALLYPAVFGGLALFFRRWLALFTVLSLNSSLYLLHGWFYGAVQPHLWSSLEALWLLMAMVALAGMVWSTYRIKDECKPAFRRKITAFLECSTLISFIPIAYYLLYDLSLISPARQPFMALAITTTTATICVEWRNLTKGPLFTEVFLLAGMTLAGIGIPLTTWLIGSKTEIAWIFKPHGTGTIFSSPAIAGNCIYVGSALDGFPGSRGKVFCLDRINGKQIWAFDDSGGMKPVISSPFIASNRLYIGEGFHLDASCKLYCLDAGTGHKLWDFSTKGHTESSPIVVNGSVYFGAGDDGLYCLDALTGKEFWHHLGPHVDAKPAVADGRVYAGSGYGEYEVFCLDAVTGKPLWRVPVGQSSFGSPTVVGDLVYFGIGTGNLVESTPSPSGALLCLDKHTGKELWKYQVPDAIHGQPVVDGEAIFFASRDGCCYCLDRATAHLRWKRQLGSPCVTTPLLLDAKKIGQPPCLCVVASAGKVWCFEQNSGSPRMEFELGTHVGEEVLVLSSPMVLDELSSHKEQRHIYFGAAIRQIGSIPAFYCLEEN